MSSTGNNLKKRPLKFVSEGVTDLESQKAREQIEQSKFETECKRRERKSLREQLRSNAINKQKDFNQLVKERDSFNRLSQEELDFFQKIKDDEKQKERDLTLYLEKQATEYEQRKLKLSDSQGKLPQHPPKIQKQKLPGVTKKKKKLKIKQKAP